MELITKPSTLLVSSDLIIKLLLSLQHQMETFISVFKKSNTNTNTNNNTNTYNTLIGGSFTSPFVGVALYSSNTLSSLNAQFQTTVSGQYVQAMVYDAISSSLFIAGHFSMPGSRVAR